jgi:signal transduction histidine kinase
MMPHRLRSPALLFFCLLQFLTSKEQTSLPGYSVVNYNSDNALPQNSINDMAFDRNGFLWLATEMGFVRFDGRNFREYNMGNTPALLSNRCYLISLAEGSGKILFETWFGSHRILTLTEDYQLKEDSVLSANPHQHNRSDNRLFSFAGIYKKWAGGSEPSPFRELLSKLEPNGDLVTVNETQAYVRKDSSYYYLDESTASIHLLPEITGHVFKIQFMVGEVYIFVDRQNRFFAYKGGRLQKEITASARLREFLSQTEVGGPYLMQANLTAIRDTSHTFLVSKGNILLLHVRDGQLDFETLAANTSIKDISCLIYDEPYRILYVGTTTSGLYILKKHDFNRLGFTSDNYQINDLYAQLELPDGRILTSSGILHPHGGVNVLSPGIYERPALLRSSDGNIWYSSYGFLRKVDSTLHNVVTIKFMGGWLESIVEAGNKDILCTNTSKLFRIRGKDVSILLDEPALLQKAEIQVIREIHPNDLWIGTSSGLFSYDLVRGTLSRLPGMEKASIRAISKARDGSIWIGTYGQGFYKYDNAGCLKMPVDPGNNLANVHCFMEDRKGYFWLPTNKGLFRVAKEELDSYASGNKENVFYYYFDKSSGFTSNEFNGGCSPCGIVTRDGHFSLPSLDGLIQFDPDSIVIALPDHPIFIDHILDDKKVSPGDHFELAQDAGPLVFAVSSPYYGNRANLHLEYSIPELDDKWHRVNDDGKLVLTGLHKGRFTLTVRKQDSYAQYSYKTTRWTIRPYWYETVWFRLLAAAVVTSILPFIFWLRYTRQVRRAEQLEQKVADRTQALSESNRVKEKMIAIILHDLRSPLRFLHMLAVHIYENHQKTPPPELSEMLLKFRTATYDLYEFAQDFVVWTNAQKEGFVIRQEKIALREIVEEIVSLYEPGADIRNNVVLNLIPSAITLVSDTHILKLLIRNLTDNANKYTVDGEIKIEALQDAATLRIIITDTGRSMEKDLIADILNNTYRTDSDSHGFGYKIILELLARIQGKLDIDTPGDKGNRITLLFSTAPANA